MRFLALACLVVAMTGCDLYWGGHNPPPCIAGGGVGGGVAVSLIDPETGQCDSEGGGVPPCDCGECPETPAQQLGGFCDGVCSALDETDCLAMAGCHAEYIMPLASSGNLAPTPLYQECWNIAPLAPIEGGDCAQDGAFICAEHDDCVSVMSGGSFQSCAAKPAAPTCAGGPAGTSVCAAGYTCGVECDQTGNCEQTCIPEHSIGSCDQTQIQCNSAPPQCPPNTIAGVENHCWSGYCIPDAECTGSCTTFTTEATCIANSCTPVFHGSGCTCTSAGMCTCTTETYQSCE
jgi:hypothetical protein